MGKGKVHNWVTLHTNLCIFKEKYKHTNVPSNYKIKILASYVRNFRLTYCQEKEGLKVNRIISTEERKALDEIGFVWEPPRTARRYYEYQDKLISFRKEKGHCNVPCSYPEDQDLADWCVQFLQNHLEMQERTDYLI